MKFKKGDKVKINNSMYWANGGYGIVISLLNEPYNNYELFIDSAQNPMFQHGPSEPYMEESLSYFNDELIKSYFGIKDEL